LAIDNGGNLYMSGLCALIIEWLNSFQRCRDGSEV